MVNDFAPRLMRSYALAPASEREAITTNFVTAYVIVISLWQALQTIPASLWLLGIGRNFLRPNTRPLGLLLLVLAALGALTTVWRLLTT